MKGLEKMKKWNSSWRRESKKSYLTIGLLLGMISMGQMSVSANEPEQAEGPIYTLQGITVEAKRPDWEAKLSPGTVTVIRPQDFKGEQKTLPDMLKTVPGVHVREVNGHGQYTTVTVRGSTAAQVGVFMDGILTNLGGDAAVDISTIPVKNVERIEVYRGYVPARFGGTFIGGVINIVTKKPDKPGISAEVGKSSYGGKSLSMEYTAPAGSGTLLVAGNYESSDNDFSYTNYAAERNIPEVQKALSGFQNQVENFNRDRIDYLTSTKNQQGQEKVPIISLSPEEVDHFKNNTDDWLSFVRGTGEGSLAGKIKEKAFENAKQEDALTFIDEIASIDVNGQTLQEYFTSELGYGEEWFGEASKEWKKSNSEYIKPEIKQKILQNYVDQTVGDTIANEKLNTDPETSKSLEGYKKQVEEYKKKLKEAKDGKRWRKYNDYKNSSALVKWQNQNWMVKGSWNQIDRHLPDGLWGGSAADAIIHNGVDLRDVYFYDSRRQKLTNTELMLQNRNQNGRLEWGWTADYLHQKKSYKAENIMKNDVTDVEATTVPLREWSKYTSNKYNIQLDGTYKVSERNMLDFQMNMSHERLHIDGSLMDKVLGDSDIANTLGQTRNRYDQDILNVQLQDTITLDRKSTWFLTPSLRYNRSKITGYSDGKRFAVNQENRFHWLHPKDSQVDDKVTWQLALKKEVNDQLTLRMTGGTYYRLLNMYEIAGDGAGILPSSRGNGQNSVFPVPEEGKQFDIGAIWKGKLLHADNSTQLTYFWRDSTNMLQLVRVGKDHWSYFNDNRGKVHGVEFQSNFSWKKVDLDLRATYMQTHMQRKNSAVGYGYSDIWATYQPEWEGNARLTYRPNQHVDLFGEVHYTGGYYTDCSKDPKGGEYAHLSGRPVNALTTINGGVKWKPADSWQFTFGCNDIFNKGPKMKIRSNTAFTVPGYINPEFPIQGRTYYASIRYQF